MADKAAPAPAPQLPANGLVIDGEAYEVCFSASLYREGLCPGLSAYDAGESSLARAMRAPLGAIRITREELRHLNAIKGHQERRTFNGRSRGF